MICYFFFFSRAKKVGSTLRRPYGYSESEMLDMSILSTNTDEESDNLSVYNEQNFGKGLGQLLNRGQMSLRGLRGMLHRRGLRGRLC